MRFTILTLFPAAFDSARATSLFGKALETGRLQVETIDIRESATDKHRTVDDAPYGGGAGMVMKVEPLAAAIERVRQADPAVRVVLLTPQGGLFDQGAVRRLATCSHLALVCGRYEGVDERVRSLVDEELSIGDFVLSGGEPAAWVVMDAVGRLVPGVLGSEASIVEESHSLSGLLEYPQYTRPRVWRDRAVPEVLLGGDHAAIAQWRRRQALARTAERRPDLLVRAELTQQERAWLAAFGTGPGSSGQEEK